MKINAKSAAFNFAWFSFSLINWSPDWPWPSQPVLNMKSCADDLSTLINSLGDLGFDDSPIHQSPLLQLGTVQFWAASAMIQCLVKDADTNKVSAHALMARIHFFPLVWLFLDKCLVIVWETQSHLKSWQSLSSSFASSVFPLNCDFGFWMIEVVC